MLVIVFIVGLGVILLYLHFQKNLYARKLEQERLNNSYQAELLRSSVQVQEEERKRIAHDLHDEMGAALSIMRMHMMMLEQKSEENAPDMLAGLRNVRSLSETALSSMRNISHRLMPPQLEAFGLVRTLEAVTGQISETRNIDIVLEADANSDGLPWEVSLSLYRIIMELVNNTLKHSGATNIVIDLSGTADGLLCNYNDNGKGLGDGMITHGLGLKSIEGRVKVHNGTFEILRGQGSGFRAHIRIPTKAVV